MKKINHSLANHLVQISTMENNDGNYVLSDHDWDRLIDSINVDEMDRQEAEANSRLEEELRNEYEIPLNTEVNWESVARYSQKQADKIKERIDEQNEQLRQIQLYLEDMRDAHERELFINELYQEQKKIEE